MLIVVIIGLVAAAMAFQIVVDEYRKHRSKGWRVWNEGLLAAAFACADTEALLHSRPVSRCRNSERVVRRKLLQMHAATERASLRVPPGNQLEALKVDRKGQHSIRINDLWRTCFVWNSDGVHSVEIADYQ